MTEPGRLAALDQALAGLDECLDGFVADVRTVLGEAAPAEVWLAGVERVVAGHPARECVRPVRRGVVEDRPTGGAPMTGGWRDEPGGEALYRLILEGLAAQYALENGLCENPPQEQPPEGGLSGER